jgi:hypothetical protein
VNRKLLQPRRTQTMRRSSGRTRRKARADTAVPPANVASRPLRARPTIHGRSCGCVTGLLRQRRDNGLRNGAHACALRRLRRGVSGIGSTHRMSEDGGRYLAREPVTAAQCVPLSALVVRGTAYPLRVRAAMDGCENRQMNHGREFGGGAMLSATILVSPSPAACG